MQAAWPRMDPLHKLEALSQTKKIKKRRIPLTRMFPVDYKNFSLLEEYVFCEKIAVLENVTIMVPIIAVYAYLV